MHDRSQNCSKCDNCAIHHRAVCHNASAAALDELNRICHIRDHRRGSIIQGQGEQSEIVGNVIEGVVRIVTSSADGQQHIVGLLFPSDFFGRPFAETSRFSFEAATDVKLSCMARKPFESFLSRNHEVEHGLLVAKFDELDAMREWAFVITGHSATQRVGTFLHMLAKKARNQICRGSNAQHVVIHVPISRRDMADYLGTTPETISRCIQGFARRKVLRILDAKNFELLNEQALIAVCGGEHEDFASL